MARRRSYPDYGPRKGGPPLTQVHHTLELPPEATLAVVSDTHSTPHPGVRAQLEALAPQAIFHAGDVGDLSVLAELASIAPLYAVRGNIDARGHGDLPDVVTMEIVQGARRLKLLMTHIAVRGPRLLPMARQLAAEHEADLLICGHSHVPFLTREGRVVVFNPGSIGPRRFALPITYGVMRLSATGLTLNHVNCETGDRWAPAA
ncbi:MAG: metallophosphoesterase family protein [Bradymonadia bacterium]